MKNKTADFLISDVKMDTGTGEFTCYGNVKNVVDFANDNVVDGAYMKSIEEHKAKGTMPLMLFMHDPYALPVGTWLDMKEDKHGLFMRGKLANTTMGKDIAELFKTKALNSFSIGYSINEEEWNGEKRANNLKSINLHEVSVVTFACNTESTLVAMKSKLKDGELPTRKELKKYLQGTGLSAKEAQNIAHNFKEKADEEVQEVEVEETEKEVVDIFAELEKLEEKDVFDEMVSE